MHLSCGIFSEIARQIDPMRLGEHARACDIATEYGIRLHGEENLDVVMKLVQEYPHHGFVIDRKEAMEFIETVRDLDVVEKVFEETVGNCFRGPLERTVIVGLLYPETDEQESQKPASEGIPAKESSEQDNGAANGQTAHSPKNKTTELARAQERLIARRRIKLGR